MHVDEDVPLDRRRDPGLLDLARLEHRVAVGDDDRRPTRAEMRQCIEGTRIQALGEGIVEEVARCAEKVRVPAFTLPPLLHGS